jgi:hypothetical protein
MATGITVQTLTFVKNNAVIIYNNYYTYTCIYLVCYIYMNIIALFTLTKVVTNKIRTDICVTLSPRSHHPYIPKLPINNPMTEFERKVKIMTLIRSMQKRDASSREKVKMQTLF